MSELVWYDAQKIPSTKKIGNKASNLFKILSFINEGEIKGIEVPNFCVLPAGGSTNAAVREVKQNLDKFDFPEYNRPFKARTRDEIFSVRSSSPYEDIKGLSFAGRFHSETNIGPNDLKRAILAVLDSALQQRAVDYAAEKGVEIDDKMAVIIQRQVLSGETLSSAVIKTQFIEGERNLSNVRFVRGPDGLPEITGTFQNTRVCGAKICKKDTERGLS